MEAPSKTSMTPEEQKQQLVRDYHFVFGSPDGQRVLADLAVQGYEDILTYVPGDANGSAFNEGKRYMVLHIRRILKLEP